MSNEHPRPKHYKPYVAHHFLEFYSDDESEKTLDGYTNISTEYHVFKDVLFLVLLTKPFPSVYEIFEI